MTAPAHASPQLYRFADLTLDVGQCRLWRGEQAIPLSKLTYSLLRVVVEAAPNLVTHDELVLKVWGPRRVVTPENLSQRMMMLRHALGEDAAQPRYIESVRGQGYRLIPDIQGVAVPSAPDARLLDEAISDHKGSRRWPRLLPIAKWRYPLAISGLVVVLLALTFSRYLDQGPRGRVSSAEHGRSVAVLPFVNLSARQEDQPFVDGIHDDILTHLAKVRELKVISRASVIEYRETDRNLREIGQELGVAAILEGGVQRSGNAVRINVQLIDAQTDTHLWAESYDRAPTAENIFAMQSEIATAVAEALAATLTPEEVARLSEVSTDSTRAYDFYLTGKDYERRGDVETRPLALQQYQRAVEEDPEFARAWARLAMAHIDMHWFKIDRSEARRSAAFSAVQRALELGPDLSEAHMAMALYHYHGYLDYEKALVELAIAERGMPGDPGLLRMRGAIYRRQGEWARALADMAGAIEVDPRNIALLLDHGVTYVALRDYTAADRYFERALELAPDSGEAQLRRALIPLFRDGDLTSFEIEAGRSPAILNETQRWAVWYAAIYDRDYAAARRYLDDVEGELLVRFPMYHLPKASAYGLTYQLAGQSDRAEQQFKIARAQLEEALEADPEDPALVMALGEVTVRLGDSHRAVSLARQAMRLMPKSRDAVAGAEIQVNAIITVFMPAGAFDIALDELEKYLAAPGEWSIEGLLPDPRLDPVRDDPRFRALVAKYQRR